MARLNNSVPASTPDVDSIYRDRTPDADVSTRHRGARSHTAYSTIASPPDASSDKENYPTGQPTRMDKGKAPMRPPSIPTPTSDTETSRSSKRRRLQDRDVSVATTANGEPIVDLQYYDPDQNADERRELRRDLRAHLRDFTDDRDALMAGNNDRLVGYIQRSNALMNRVKQTADATLDARFLVAASDLTLRKTTAMVMGANSTGVDVDEFVSKCILFMQNNGYVGEDDQVNTQAASTQARVRKRARRADVDSDDEQEETGDALAWDVLGERACFQNNRRPPVPGFLLGPLSVQKRVRATQTQRRARLRRDPQLERRPESLVAEDIQRPENSNLVTLVKKIRGELMSVLDRRQDAVNDELSDYPGDPPEDVIEDVMQKHGITQTEDEDPAMSLFEFTINPQSFGQTVENLFYTSFLIREGSVRVGKDKHGLPVICPSESRGLNEQGAKNVSRHQAVFSIDYQTWQKFIEAFNIQEPVIAHRQDEQPTQSVRGWYG
ncbi:nuclear protein qri2 nse4 [Diplodia corticola]|uniref:Non-structural maintenance of chromosomes element 4 n=1 Tax=Diplodia corticola TaxID=236234 RepID=A0A1J9RQV1_9PEZI|nr:nuclear protein qri2 nse4 [Diplodia corticola]OJD30276.1 nuclear protein qri2 nse4 [Diplodia corticola]